MHDRLEAQVHDKSDLLLKDHRHPFTRVAWIEPAGGRKIDVCVSLVRSGPALRLAPPVGSEGPLLLRMRVQAGAERVGNLDVETDLNSLRAVANRALDSLERRADLSMREAELAPTPSRRQEPTQQAELSLS